MFKYILKRLGLSLIILLGVSIIIYFLIRLMPSDYVEQKFSSQLQQGTIQQEDLDHLKDLYGLGDSSLFGILKGYFDWLKNMLHGDFGYSFLYKKPVFEAINEHIMISFWLAFISMILEFLIAIPLGIHAARNQYGKFDYTATVFVILGISLPSFFLGTLLLKLFAIDLQWLPLQGLRSANTVFTGSWNIFIDYLRHLILPVFVLVILGIGGLMRYTRTNMLEVLNSDYIRTARAKGLPEHKVINKHAFRNTLIPLVTMLAGIIPGLFGGAMITETVFSIPGVGQMSYNALVAGDIPFVMAYNMFLAVLTVIGILLSDLAYALVDPRVKIAK